MKKSFSVCFLVIGLLISRCALAQDNYEQERSIRKKNQINRMRTYQYDLATGDSVMINDNYYDRNGSLIKRLGYDQLGVLQFSSVSSYNAKGLMIEDKGYDAQGNYVQKYIYAYDSSGNQTDYQQFHVTGRLLVHQKTTYNAKNQPTEMYTKLSRQPLFQLSLSNRYNSKGQLVRAVLFSDNSEIMSEFEYKYNLAGQKVEEYRVLNNRNYLTERLFYNTNGQLVKRQAYRHLNKLSPNLSDSYESTLRREYRYDKDGNKVEETVWNGKSLLERKRYFFTKHK